MIYGLLTRRAVILILIVDNFVLSLVKFILLLINSFFFSMINFSFYFALVIPYNTKLLWHQISMFSVISLNQKIRCCKKRKWLINKRNVLKILQISLPK